MTLSVWDVERIEREQVHKSGGVDIEYLDTTIKVFKTQDNQFYHFSMSRDESVGAWSLLQSMFESGADVFYFPETSRLSHVNPTGGVKLDVDLLIYKAGEIEITQEDITWGLGEHSKRKMTDKHNVLMRAGSRAGFPFMWSCPSSSYLDGKGHAVFGSYKHDFMLQNYMEAFGHFRSNKNLVEQVESCRLEVWITSYYYQKENAQGVRRYLKQGDMVSYGGVILSDLSLCLPVETWTGGHVSFGSI